MKQILLLLTTCVVTALAGCNSGGSGTGTAYLPAGTYSVVYSNPQPAACDSQDPDTIISNGKGNITFESGNTIPLNLASNPCLNSSIESSGISIGISWGSCSLTNNTLKAKEKMTFSVGQISQSCSYDVNATQK